MDQGILLTLTKARKGSEKNALAWRRESMKICSKHDSNPYSNLSRKAVVFIGKCIDLLSLNISRHIQLSSMSPLKAFQALTEFRFELQLLFGCISLVRVSK